MGRAMAAAAGAMARLWSEARNARAARRRIGSLAQLTPAQARDIGIEIETDPWAPDPIMLRRLLSLR